MSFNREKYERQKWELTLKLMQLPAGSPERDAGGELLMRLQRLGQDLNYLEALGGRLSSEQQQERARIEEIVATWKEKLSDTETLPERIVPQVGVWTELFLFVQDFADQLQLAQAYIELMATQLLSDSEAA